MYDRLKRIYGVQCKPCIVRRTVYTVYCTAYSVHRVLYDVQCTAYNSPLVHINNNNVLFKII